MAKSARIQSCTLFEKYETEGDRLSAANRLPEAATAYKKALALQPDALNLYHKLGIVLEKAGNTADAARSFRQLLSLRGDHPDIYSNLGRILYKDGHVTEAENCFRRAIALKPDVAGYHLGLGIVLVRRSNLDEGGFCFRKALDLKPGFPEALYNQAWLLLLTGHFEEGWEKYEARHELAERRTEALSPEWDGAPVGRLMVLCEQGSGDSFQFVRYLPMARKRCGHLILKCPENLKSLLAGFPGVDTLADISDPVPYDAGIHLLGLPRIFRTVMETIPAAVPYIRASAKKIAQWRNVMVSGALNVGLVWAGNPMHQEDRNRSLHLETLAPLARVAGAVFHSLQVGQSSEEADHPPAGFSVRSHTDRIQDFSDTAALVAALDLVISVDTATAHLAGAMGRPVWTLLPFIPDWRWLLDRDDSPWYPSMRLFRQTEPGKWDAVISRVAIALQEQLDNRKTGETETMTEPQAGVNPVQAPDMEPVFRNCFHQGDIFLKDGKAADALNSYGRALEIRPDSPELLSNMGIAAERTGDAERAENFYRRALEIRPHALVFNHLGDLLRRKSRFAEARNCLQQALSLNPEYPAAARSLGAVCMELGDRDGAASCFENILKTDPGASDAHYNLGVVCKYRNQPDRAEVCFRRAIELKPDYSDAHVGLGVVLNDAGKPDEALAAYHQALAVNPGHVEALVGMGIILRDRRQFDDALKIYQRAVRLRPGHVEAVKGLGMVLKDCGRFDEALAAYGQVLRNIPDHIETLLSVGNVYKAMMEPDKAAEWYRKAIEKSPDYARAHLFMGMILLTRGDFENGWPEYEWRWQAPPLDSLRPRYAPVPLWDGRPLDGRTILLHTEQGYGDSIQFVRYVSLVAACGGKIVLECERPLMRLFSGIAGVENVFAKGEKLPPVRCRASLLNLPGILGTRVQTIPADTPYLFPPEPDIRKYREMLAPYKGLKVGLVWAGNPSHQKDSLRSVSLEQFRPVIDVPGVCFFSLQAGARAADARNLPFCENITDLSENLSDFAATAAIIMSLDMVISVDTAVAHLAGALGKPVWVLVQYVPDWRWLTGREDSPWYPSMRLFRQQAHDQWSPVIVDLADALRNLVRDHRPAEDRNPVSGIPGAEGITGMRQCRHGQMLYLRRDIYLGRSLELYGEFSEGETAIFRQIVRPGDVVVEAGANIGTHTIFLARTTGAAGCILAYEPQRVIHQILCANLSLNGIWNVHARQAGLGSAPGMLRVPRLDYGQAFNFGGVSLGQAADGESVPVETLDSLNLSRLRLLKADVEGMEAEVIRGALQTIVRCRPVLYLENDRKEKSAELVRLVLELGYRLWWHLPPLFNPQNFAGNRENVFGGIISVNLLCLPAEMPFRIDGLREVRGPEDSWCQE